MRIGPYTVGEPLGEGGMGVVYRAWDAEHEREVALKLISARANPERFQREADALARVTHPHVVPIFASGVDQGRPWLAMALVEGPSLAAVLEQRRTLAPDEAVRITRDLASAVGELHRLGLLHRDIKPANVLLQDGSPLLSDFGLARATDAERLTQTGQIMGTPGYAAPELLLGESPESIGPAVDVYGLGATLYALLTGAPPTHGETLTEALVATASTVPLAPHAINPDVSERLAELCLRCLEKQPAQRPSLEQLLAGLDGLEANRTRARGWTQAGVGALALALAGGVALGVAGGGGDPPLPGSRPEISPQVEPPPSPAATAPTPARVGLRSRFEAMEHRLRRGDLEAARWVLERAKASGCSDRARRILEARLLVHGRKHAAALELLAPIKDRDPSGLALFLIGQSYAQRRDHVKALAAYERALSVQADPWFRIARAKAAVHTQQWEIAESDTVALQGPIPRWLEGSRENLRALLLLQLGRATEGLRILARVIATFGLNASRQSLHGRLLEAERRDLPAAKQALDKALETQPRNLILWTARIRAAVLSKDAADTRRCLERGEALPRLTTTHKNLFQLGRIWLAVLEGGEPEQVRQRLRRFRPRGVEAQLMTGQLCRRLGQNARAKKILERVAASKIPRFAREAQALLADTQ